MGPINSTHKLSIDSMALLEMLEPTAQELEYKQRVYTKIQAVLMKTWPTIRVMEFGSSQSGLAFGQSDLDLGIFFNDLSMDWSLSFTPHDRITFLTSVCTCLKQDFQVIELVHSARVPVVKLWDPEFSIACDLCIGSTHVLLNTTLLKQYTLLDRRVRPLVFAVKYWAKQRGINDSLNGTLSSYAWVLLVLFYLQSKSILPSVSPIFASILKETSFIRVIELLESIPSHPPLESLDIPSLTQMSVGILLSGFFQFYASEFQYVTDVVSVRMGTAISKVTAWNRLVPWRLSIEDPFETSHDVGRVMFNPKGQALLHHEFQRAVHVIKAQGRLEDICSTKDVWTETSSCYICQSCSHTPRECPQSTDSCWNCGDRGHVKYACPLLLSSSPPPRDSFILPRSAPRAIRSPHIAPLHDRVKILSQEELMYAPSKGKKKKRRRNGSISSLGSSPDQDRSRKCSLTSRVLVNRKSNRIKNDSTQSGTQVDHTNRIIPKS